MSSNSSDGHQQHICLNFLQGFHGKESRNKHFECCINNETDIIDMSEENSFMRFHSGQYQFKVPFVIYADFEAILQSSEEGTSPDPQTSYTRDINCHVPSGFCTYTTSAYREVEYSLRLYRGKECIMIFCNHIKEEAKRFYYMFCEKLMEPLTLEQWRELE